MENKYINDIKYKKNLAIVWYYININFPKGDEWLWQKLHMI